MIPAITILYVDDDPDIRTVVAMALGLDRRMEVRMASSGSEAVALLRDAAWRPDAIVLDMMMPTMDGAETLAAIRSIPGCAEIPTIFMTARVRRADQDLQINKGPIGLILKPFDPLTLPGEIRSILCDLRQADKRE